MLTHKVPFLEAKKVKVPINHMSNFNADLKNSIGDIETDKNKILQTQEGLIPCLSSSTMRTYRLDFVSEGMPKFVFIKVTETFLKTG